VRAKKTLADAHVPYEVPRGDELPQRLASVLEVIYLVFNEGYAATAGDDWMRPGPVRGRAAPRGACSRGCSDEAEVHGLVALMELQASRIGARTAADGTPILLLEQDRGRWDRLLIGADSRRSRARSSLGPTRAVHASRPAIAACHARRARPGRRTGRASRRSTRRS
jgi:predicted RNA polymerase sigma factor